MNSNSGGLVCAATCWGVSALVGVFAGVMLLMLGGWTPLQAIFAALFILLVLGVVLTFMICRPMPGPNEVRLGGAGAGSGAGQTASAPAAAAPKAAPAAAPKPASAPKPAPAPKSAAAPAATTGAASRPQGLDAPRGGAADDLKRIKGVGPKLEKLLNSMGYYHFDQVAGWTAHEVAWVDENLEGFKGRVTRDNWVEQAKLLAAGGETDFSRKVDKGDVY